MKYLLHMVLLLVAAAALAACFEQTTGKIFPVAGFCSEQDNRIIAAVYKHGTSKTEMRKYGLEARYTLGSNTIVYFYPTGTPVPAQQLDQSKSLEEAHRIVNDPARYSHIFIRKSDGLEKFAACTPGNKNELCVN